MLKICIQPGHAGKAGAGAPEEQANNKRIADRVCGMLRERSFEVYQTDYYGYNDPKVIKEDYSLFLSLHCDMDYPNDGGSGFADYADPATDLATKESQRICKIINDFYFPEVKINYVSHSNANTRFYYMWKHLTAKTPCVLLEMGQSIDPHDKVLLANTDLIASAIVRCICKAFNVPYDLAPPPETCEEQKAKLIKENTDLKLSQKDLEIRIANLSVELATEQKSSSDWQSQLKTANKTNQTLSADLAYYKPYKALYEATLKKTIDKYTGWELIKLGVKKLSIKK
jgi:hypothetical protein